MKTHKYLKGLYCIVIVVKNRLTFDSASYDEVQISATSSE